MIGSNNVINVNCKCRLDVEKKGAGVNPECGI